MSLRPTLSPIRGQISMSPAPTREQTSTPKLTGQFSKAMVYAERKHHTQVRKGGDIPYVGHLLSVAGLVINDDGSEAQAVAALLHDAVEDAGGQETLNEIRAEFGDELTRHRSHRGENASRTTSITLAPWVRTRFWCRWPTSSTTRGRW